jgi:hypothetical protein
MSIVAKFEVERADRVKAGRGGTLRDKGKYPVDVLVANISQTGCLIELTPSLPVGSLVTLGLPGIGMHVARVSRADGAWHGCAFLVPIVEDQIALVRKAETVFQADFPQMARRAAEAPDAPAEPTREPDLALRIKRTLSAWTRSDNEQP